MVGAHIGDFINRLTTAQMARKESVSLPFSNLKFAVAEVLKNEGFVATVEKKGKKVKKLLEVTLIYQDGGKPQITGAERISRPSRRLYMRASEIRPVKNGYGMLVLSTPSGILSGGEAKKQNVGGEPLFKIW